MEKIAGYLPSGDKHKNDDWLAVVKGILIILVVIDHNEYLRKIGSDLFSPLYIHVAGFFIIAYMATIKNTESFFDFTIKRFKRYGLAFLCFYIIYSVLAVVSRKIGPVDIYWVFDVWLRGLAIGSFRAVKNGCGAAFMWFLPALFGFVTLVKLSMISGLIRLMLCFSSLVVWLAPNWLIENYIVELPLGIGLSIYLFFILFFSEWFCKIYLHKYKAGLVFYFSVAFALIASHIILIYVCGVVELGAVVVPSIGNPIGFFVLMIGLMACYFFIFKIKNSHYYSGYFTEILSYIGNRSISIFLLHQIFLHIYYYFFGFLGYGLVANFLAGFGGVLFSLFLSLVILKIYNYCLWFVINKSAHIGCK
jgi:hypothetical protein